MGLLLYFQAFHFGCIGMGINYTDDRIPLGRKNVSHLTDFFSIRLKIPEYKRTILAMKTLFHTGVVDSYHNPQVLRVHRPFLLPLIYMDG